MAEELEAALLRVARSGRYLRSGEQDAFEEEFAAHTGVGFCIGVASGTDALELALLGVGCAPGDEVLTAANAGMYATTAAVHAGLRPSYADVDSETLSLSHETVEEALRPETRAVVVTHLVRPDRGRGGNSRSVPRARRRGRSRIVPRRRERSSAGRRAGSFADAAAFSFYPTKNLGALGDAGAVLTDRSDVAPPGCAASASTAGPRSTGWSPPRRLATPRIDELQAAVLRVRLPHLAAWNSRPAERWSDATRPALPARAGRFVARRRRGFRRAPGRVLGRRSRCATARPAGRGRCHH